MSDNSLYDLVRLKLQIDAALVQSGGEITPEIDAMLSFNAESLSSKLDSYYHVIRGAEKEEEYWKAEAKRMSALANGYQTLRNALNSRLQEAMLHLGVRRLEGKITAVRLQTNAPSLKITDESKLPAEYRIAIIEVDKAKLKSDLVEGHMVSGAEIVRSESIRLALNKKAEV